MNIRTLLMVMMLMLLIDLGRLLERGVLNVLFTQGMVRGSFIVECD